ncbi:hypothetical protein [Streptomyces sp. NPDC093094]|uniref:hypothetical protein n=1 Tax=Streptomyces sp. NPDC093094 TaxID=3366026 RepID=UPI0038043329
MIGQAVVNLIGHHRAGSGWTLRIDQSTPLGDVVPAGDGIVGLTPAWDGRIWFATGDGTIGTVDTSTYGYPYPALPAGAPVSRPSSADFDGGLSRIDIDAEGTGCSVVWNSPVESAALPRLSLADGKICTVSVTGPTGSVGLNTFAQYHRSVIDPATGAQPGSSFPGIGLLFNPLQMRGTAAPDGALHQGTETGVVGISER